MNAVLTKLGKESSICGNQIVVHDAAKRNMASHHFGISCKVKDISSRQMLENMYNTEFCESRIKMGIGESNNMKDISNIFATKRQISKASKQ